MTSVSELRAAAFDRDQGMCFVTGRSLGDRWELHHRQPGGMGGRGGRDVLSNVVCLLPEVHNLGGGGRLSVHGHPTWSRPRGWLLSTLEDEPYLRRPALHWSGRWVFLTDDGDMVPVT